MRKIINILFCSLIICACSNIDQENDSLQEMIIGEWVFDIPEDGRWETMQFTGSGAFFYSTKDIALGIDVEDNSGRYTLEDDTVTGTYNLNGASMNLCMDISKISYQSFTALFKNSGLRFTYSRLLSRERVKPNETITPDYKSLVKSKITGYSSHKPNIASVDASTGVITGVSSGRTYIDVITEDGTAAIEVTSLDEANLFDDYTFAFGKTVPEIIDIMGNKYLERNNKIGVVYLSDNFIVDTLTFYTGVYDDTHIETVHMTINNNITSTQIINSLNNQFELLSKTKSSYSYITDQTVDGVPVILVYNQDISTAYYFVLGAYTLWEDLNYLYGADKDKVRTTLPDGDYSFIQSDYSYSANGSDYYLIKDNNYAYMVGFVFNTDDKMCEYWVYLKDDVSRSDIFDALSAHYEYSDTESTTGRKIFYDNGQRQRITFNLEGTVTYTDTKQTPFEPANKLAWPDFCEALDMTREQILAKYGSKTYANKDEYITYTINNEYIYFYMFMFDENHQYVTTVATSLHENIPQSTIIEYLNTIYIPFMVSEDGTRYSWVNSSTITGNTIIIIYDIPEGDIYYMHLF